MENDKCHCGHPMWGSDHCPACACEAYESTCYQDNSSPRTCPCPRCEGWRAYALDNFGKDYR